LNKSEAKHFRADLTDPRTGFVTIQYPLNLFSYEHGIQQLPGPMQD